MKIFNPDSPLMRGMTKIIYTIYLRAAVQHLLLRHNRRGAAKGDADRLRPHTAGGAGGVSYLFPVIARTENSIRGHLRIAFIVLFDYLEGETEHRFDSLMQIKGLLGIDGAEFTRNTEQMDPDPVSDAQFITDCNWYEAKDGSTAHFRTVFTENDAVDLLRGDRSNWNEPGILKMDVHTAWPRWTEQMVGRVAIYDGWAR